MPSSASPFLTARWVDLAMVNYEVDPALVRALVPAGTELDLWSGRCLVSVVGFQFLETRVLGLALPFHRNFEEVNLRFYVRRTVGDEARRGVVFVKEIVPRRAIAWMVAKRFLARCCTSRTSISCFRSASLRSLISTIAARAPELPSRMIGFSPISTGTSVPLF